MKVEWELDLKIKVDGEEINIDKLPPILTEQLVYEATNFGLRTCSGEFDHAWK